MSASTPKPEGQDTWFVKSLERVVGVLVMPVALIAHRRTFRRMKRDWEAGHRP